ncbi:phosphotransferase [Streptomyces sp. SID8379]|nr:phosphotransferase [Streptomyces sp. SID8379]
MAHTAFTRGMRKALALSADEQAIMGPLKGFHHDTYVFPLTLPGAEGAGGRWKCREPRDGLFWFDRRCFPSEAQVIAAVGPRVRRIPGFINVGDVRLQRFVEGDTLGASCPADDPVPDRYVRHIMELFGELVLLRPWNLYLKPGCKPEDRVREGDTKRFLQRLVSFVQRGVYASHRDEFGVLFASLGVGEETFRRLYALGDGMAARPFCLLHADLHRENLIVDLRNELWVIDWELAMFGDPLYDLATHLYLMRYPEEQERRVIDLWTATVESGLPGSSRGAERDLSRLLDFKRAQSVFTDVIRAALHLKATPDVGTARADELTKAVRKTRHVLDQAAKPLGIVPVPEEGEIRTALEQWLDGSG